MIPLNRPCIFSGSSPDFSNVFLTNDFKNYNLNLFFSSRDGLNVIYRNLYNIHGSLRVLVSPLTCFFALYPIVMNGHIPIFVDVDFQTFNVNEKEVINRHDVQAIQIIYLGGNPVNLDVILPWAIENNIIIVEDCAQALGSQYNEKLLGTFGDFSVFSMVKNLHAVAGGLMLSKTNVGIPKIDQVPWSVMMYKKMKRFLESRASAKRIGLFNLLYKYLLLLKEGNESWKYGNPRRFNEIDECKILSLLADNYYLIEKRLEVTDLLISRIDKNKYFIQQEVDHGKSNRNRLLLLSKNRCAKDLISELRGSGIAANNLTQSYLNGFQENVKKDKILGEYYSGDLDVYEEINQRLVAIPNSPSLSVNEINYIVEKVNEIN